MAGRKKRPTPGQEEEEQTSRPVKKPTPLGTEPEREWSPAMRDTPRKRRFEHALRGYWDRFPVSPAPYAKEIGSHFDPWKFYPERASFGLSKTLDRYVEKAAKLSKSGQHAEA